MTLSALQKTAKRVAEHRKRQKEKGLIEVRIYVSANNVQALKEFAKSLEDDKK